MTDDNFEWRDQPDFQLLEAMNQDSGIPITSLQVDGGMTKNALLMQLQSDLIGIPVGTFYSFISWIKYQSHQKAALLKENCWSGVNF